MDAKFETMHQIRARLNDFENWSQLIVEAQPKVLHMNAR
jgi:hypothetical protein